MKYLILGATGTLGRATIKSLLSDEQTQSIVCLSRDELKQAEMRAEFRDDRLKFVLGDVRDKSSIRPHFGFGLTAIFHFAALKRIPEMEANPVECFKTNIQGTINSAECAIEAQCLNFIFSSTDKACLPINTYGASKFLSEQYLFSLMAGGSSTNFSVYRWGNVLGSRGSVIHAFKDSLKRGPIVGVTDKGMTRFWIRIEDAVKFMLETYLDRSTKPKIPPMKAAGIVSIACAVAEVVRADSVFIEDIGIRPGEKMHEDIDIGRSSQNAERYSDAELVQLIEGVL